MRISHILSLVLVLPAGCGEADDLAAPLESPDACNARFLVYAEGGNSKGRCGDQVSADAYLAAVSADNLEQWKSSRCLSDAAPQFELGYFNDGDLALGRGLHMATCNNGIVAAYVSNFGTPGQTINDGLHALANEQSPVAVAMDHIPARGPGYEVQFHIYRNDGPVNTLEFDAEGPKFSPFSCTTCHGGRYEPETGLVRGASFLPLLKEALYFDFALEPDEEESLRHMNALIREISTPPGIRMLIDAAYPGGVNTLGATYQKKQVPPSWQTEAELYQEVVRPYCINCHSAHTTEPFDSATDMSLSKWRQFACDPTSPMPQAQEMRRHFNDDSFARTLLGCQ